MTLVRSLINALIVTTAVACNGDHTGLDATSGDASSECATANPSAQIFVSTTTYEAGALSILNSAALTVSNYNGLISSDGVLGWNGSNLVALNFTGGGQDNITFFDTCGDAPLVTCQIALQGEIGTSSADPRSFLSIDPHRGYVARLYQSSLAIVDPIGCSVTGTIDLSMFRGNEVLPNPIAIARVGAYAWTALERLPPGLTAPTEVGMFVAIDPTTDAIVDLDPTISGAQGIALQHANPMGRFAVRGSTIWVACVGAYADAHDGAVESIDTLTRTASTVVTEDQIGGNIDAVLPLDDDRLLLRVVSPAIGTGLSVDHSQLVEWVRSTQQARVWIDVPFYSLSEPILARDGRVYVGDRGDEMTHLPAGIRIFQASTGTQITTAPIALTLPPYQLSEVP